MEKYAIDPKVLALLKIGGTIGVNALLSAHVDDPTMREALKEAARFLMDSGLSMAQQAGMTEDEVSTLFKARYEAAKGMAPDPVEVANE